MIHEIRQIIFSTEEIKRAFISYRKVVPEFMPNGEVTGCNPAPNGEVSLDVTVRNDNQIIMKKILMKRIDVVKPIIRFCVDCGIKLPRQGKKSITVGEGTITLVVQLTTQVELIEPDINEDESRVILAI